MKGKASRKLIKGEMGQALMIVLIMMLFGSIIVVPVLSHMGTGLKVGQEVFEEKMYQLYAADSGVEDAIWRVQNDKLTDVFSGYDPYYYEADYPPYSLPSQVNGKDVNITLKNVWIPKDIDAPGPDEARLIIEGTEENPPKLMIVGGLSGTSATQYQIGIIYYYGSEGTSALRVKKIGIWLPAGFHYAGNCSLASDPDTTPYSEPDVYDPYKSGEAVVWDFSSLLLNNFPGSGSTGSPMVKSFTFQFSGPLQQFPGAAVSWVDTTGVSGINYTWDADVKVYAITSAAGVTGKETTVEAYAGKIEMRKLGAARSGDYVAIGNTLMMPDPSSTSLRSRLLKQSSASITAGSGEGQIPVGATVAAAYLYWSGFIDHYYWYYHTNQGHGDPDATGWYFSSNSDDGLGTLYNVNNLPGIIANAKVGTVSFGTTGAMQDVTAEQWEVYLKNNDSYPQDQENCWYYCCLYDATDMVKQPLENAIKPGGSGTCNFTLSHVNGVINQTPPRPGFPRVPSAASSDHTNGYSFYLYNSSGTSTVGYTGYPLGTPATKLPGDPSYNPNKQRGVSSQYWTSPNRYNASYTGWSLVIIYSTPDTKGHQLYLYDIKNPNFKFTEAFSPNDNPDFDGDGTAGGKVSGFLVPAQISGETNAAKLTCFVGEGDAQNTGEHIRMNGANIAGAYNNPYIPDGNMWNSSSVVTSAPGIDIDTFYVTWSSGILEKDDTWAQVDLPSPNDGITLIYIILSFRSKVTSGGTLSYLVR